MTNDRVAGADRFGTAAAACTEAYEGGTDTVIIATARDFPDALAASGIAGANAACILLTEVDSLPEATRAAIGDLGATNAIIVGGTAAVSQDVEDALNDDAGVTTTRVAGTDRFETAGEIASAIGTAGELEGEGPTAILASGRSSADALAAGPIAAAGDGTNQVPILLTEQNELPAATTAAIDELGITNIIVVGGTGVISEAVRDDAGAAAGDDSVTVLAGTDRNKTAVAIAEFTVTELGWAPETVLLANSRKPAGAEGVDFGPDALVGGPLGALRQAPILLVESDSVLGADTEAFLDDHSDTITEILIMGGTAAINDQAETAAVAAAENTENDAAVPGDSVTASLAGPELQSCAIGGLDTDDLVVVLNYTFDSDVDDSVDEADFKLYNKDTRFEAAGDDEGTDAEVDGDTVSVTYSLLSYGVLDAVLCAVETGAVEDADGNTNPAQSIGVTPTFPNGIQGADLVGAAVSDADAGEVTYTFAEATTVDGKTFSVVLEDGTTITADSSETTPEDDESSTTIVATFSENEDNDCTTTCVGDAVRGVVAFDIGSVLTSEVIETADIARSGRSDGPDLNSVEVSTSADTVTFVFDEDIDSPSVGDSTVIGSFHVAQSHCSPSTLGGALTVTAGVPCEVTATGISFDEDDPREIVATFPANTVSADFTVGAFIDAGAVNDDADGDPETFGGTTIDNGDDWQAITTETDAGDTPAPQLSGVTVEIDNTAGGNFDKFIVTFTFDADIEDETLAGGFTLWGDDEFGETEQIDLDSCEVTDDAEVTCEDEDEDSPIANATVGSVDAGAVDSADLYTLDDANTSDTAETSVSLPNPEGSFGFTATGAPDPETTD